MVTRRLFVWGGGLGVVSLATGGILFSRRSSTTDDFLKEEYVPPSDLNQLIATTVPIGGEYLRRRLLGDQIFEVVPQQRDSILTHLSETGSSIEDIALELTREKRAVPVNPKYARGLEDYCRAAIEFLYSHLEGLRHLDINWIAVKSGDDYRTGFEGKSFLCEKFIEVDYTYLKHVPSGTKREIYRQIGIGHGSKGVILTRTDSSGNHVWDIVLARDSSALVAPFAEVLPLMTYQITRKYIDSVGEDQGMAAEEAVTEGISYVLGRQFARERKVPYSESRIEASYKLLERTPVYRDVTRAIRWIQRNGVQEAFNLYMQNPGNFVRAIQAA